MADSFLVERTEHVLTVTLNRPEQRNAFTDPMRFEMRDFWIEVREDRAVRCVVVTGAGKGFCAGADMGDLDGERAPLGDDIHDELAFLPGRWLDVPVIVAVNGVCAGGGLHFVADADIVIASEAAWFTDPHVGVGQVSGIEAPSLGLRVPVSMLARMVLLGRHERWDAHQALALGLVTEVVPPDQLLPRGAGARRLDRRGVARGDPPLPGGVPALRGTRRRRRHGRRMGLGAATLGPSRLRRRTPRVRRASRPGLAGLMPDDLATTPLPADMVGLLEGLTNHAGHSSLHRRAGSSRGTTRDALRRDPAPSGSNRQPFRFLVLTDGPNARARRKP